MPALTRRFVYYQHFSADRECDMIPAMDTNETFLAAYNGDLKKELRDE